MGSRYNRVAVIGAGISGVVSALHLKSEGIEVVVFERSKVAGGVWAYDTKRPLDPEFPSLRPLDEKLVSGDDSSRLDVLEEILKVGPDEKKEILLRHAPPGPCYQGLMNNVSTPLMEIKNQEWPSGTPDFVTHDILGNYVQQVPVRGSLQDSIRFNTRVSKLWKNGDLWNLESIELVELDDGSLKKLRRVEDFDAVVVASGHYDLANIPDIPGLWEWKERFPAKVHHSKSYRTPSDFVDQNVLLIGAGVSAADIAKELGPVAKQIIQVTRGGKRDLPVEWLPPNGKRVNGNIRTFNLNTEASTKDGHEISGTVVLEDGTVLQDIHRVIVCTGYHMSYPFLRDLHVNKQPQDLDSDEYTLVSDGTQTHNLHKDIFYIPDPSLVFVGIPYYTATFSLFDIQAVIVSKVFAGKAKLPSRKEMRHEYLQRLKSKGHGRDFHNLMNQDVEYANELVEWINGDLVKIGDNLVEGHSARWHEAYQRRLEVKEEILRFK